MNTNKTHYLFDLDDTLTDSYQFNQQTFVDAFADYLDISQPDVDSYLRTLHFSSRGKSMHSQFAEAANHFALRVEPQTLVSIDEKLQLKNAHKMKLFDAVEEMIRTLKKEGKQVSVLSNRQSKSLMRILDTHGLTPLFSNIISCTDEGYEKPDPYCLKRLIRESRTPKKEFIYFGDSKTDYEFASAAGIDFIVIDHYLNKRKFYKMILEAFM